MAARKETIWQRDFSLGAIRPEAVERDDTALVESAVEECLNTITLSTGQLEQRPGLLFLSETTGTVGFEVVLGGGEIYELVINESGLDLYDASGTSVFSVSGYSWKSVSGVWGSPSYSDLDFWVVPDADTSTIIIGAQHIPMHRIYPTSSGWAFGLYVFSESLVGTKNVPFWRHYPNANIKPSATTGSITITSNLPIWQDEHIGSVIRYADRQIELTSRTSATVMNGTVIEELPPTLNITVASASGFQIGDAVEAATSGGQGIITTIAGTTVQVLVTTNFSGFNTGEDLVGPNASSNMSAISTVLPASTFLWDMQLWTQVHGYPGFGARHVGRLFLCDFPSTPNAFCASAAQDIVDLSMGPNDGDGFAESIGADTGGALKYMLSAEDLLFFTTNGLYYQTTRDGSPITPSNIRPVRFSRFGCSSVRPVAVDDGAVFVGASGNQIHAAVLAGDIYRSWRVKQISKYAPHLIQNPVRLGATSSGSENPEMFVMAVLENGNMAVAQWDRDDDKISWRPWETNGNFIDCYQFNGNMCALVDRDASGSVVSYRERFAYGAYLDCMSSLYVTAASPTGTPGFEYLGVTGALATHLSGQTVQVYFENFDMGDLVISPVGRPYETGTVVLSYPEGNEGFVQIGYKFDMLTVPWPRTSAKTSRGIREVKRTVMMFVTVQSSSAFTINGVSYGGYMFGDDLSVPPPLRATQFKVALIGVSAYPRVEIKHDRPGPFRLLKLGYRVVV